MQDNDASPEPLDADVNAQAPLQAQLSIQQIDFDLNCVRCGYNLRSASAEGHCPECGEPVVTTLRPDLLHMANPTWLGKLRKGANWLIAGIVMNLALIPVGMLIGFATVVSNSSSNGTLPTVALAALSGLGLIIALTYGVAIWLITEPEPELLINRTSRSLMRWLIIPAMIISLPTDFLSAAGQPALMFTAAGIEFISSILALVGFVAGMLYLRLLADRIPEPSLARQTTTVCWGVIVTMSIMILFSTGITFFVLIAANSTNANASAKAFGAIGLLLCPVLLAALVFGIWWIVLMFQYRTRFTQAYEIALGQKRA
ncbi:MAG: hypothetical protein AB8C95_11690 [Phycisphaeraceae bacterium]